MDFSDWLYVGGWFFFGIAMLLLFFVFFCDFRVNINTGFTDDTDELEDVDFDDEFEISK